MTMIDTIKLVIKMSEPLTCTANFQPRLDAIHGAYKGYFKAVCNPSAASKKQGIYQPRLTYTQRPGKTQLTAAYELMIELSLPKLVFGNNFEELQETSLSDVTDKLVLALRDMGIWLFSHQIEGAEVRSIHYSKNIVFRDYTSCSSVLKMLRSADVSRVYDVQRTDFRNGQVLHIHTNSLDIAIYDKLADLRQARTSEKRAVEKDNATQLNVYDALAKVRPVAVLRHEVRLGAKAKIRSSLEAIGYVGPLTLAGFYSVELAQCFLMNHWDSFFANLPKLVLDSDEPDKVFANILLAPDLTGPREAMAQLGMTVLMQGSDHRGLRTLVEDRFGSHAWARLKPLLKKQPRGQYKAILAVTKALDDFKPTHLEEIKDSLETST